MKIFLDVDGVLVDWCRGAHAHLGLGWPGNDKWPYARGPKGWDWNKEVGLTYEQVFGKMGYDFWRNLNWMGDGKEILAMCESTAPVYLLTSPAHTKGTVEGRLKWIEENMPEYRKRTLVGTCKGACANSDAVLVDDNDGNIKRWEDAGGTGLLVPRPWNSNEHLDHSTVGYVAGFLDGLEGAQ